MTRWVGLAVLVGACACKGPEETSQGTPAATETTMAAPTMPAGHPHGDVLPATGSGPSDITWTMPSGWASEPVVGMRKATYRIKMKPGDSEDATVSVIQAGGSVDSNVERWKSQFDNPHDIKRSDKTVGPITVTTVEVHGTFTGGGVMMGDSPNPRPGWTLVGAIVPTASQPYFFKMLGPDNTVAASRPDFQALVDSIRAK